MRGYALPNDGPVNEADLSTNHQATIATITANALAAERALDDRLIAALRSDLAAERAISDELFACTYASLESGRLERARDAWREARRERQ